MPRIEIKCNMCGSRFIHYTCKNNVTKKVFCDECNSKRERAYQRKYQKEARIKKFQDLKQNVNSARSFL